MIERRRHTSPMRRTTGRVVDIPERDLDLWARSETYILAALLVAAVIVTLITR